MIHNIAKSLTHKVGYLMACGAALVVITSVQHASALEDYSLTDIPVTPTQISNVAYSRNFEEAQEYCADLPTDNSQAYHQPWMKRDQSKIDTKWRVPSYLELLSAVLLDVHPGNNKTLVTDKDSSEYYWTIDSSAPISASARQQQEAERLVMRLKDRNWYYSNGKFRYHVRCVR